jgi:hypothetical protein
MAAHGAAARPPAATEAGAAAAAKADTTEPANATDADADRHDAAARRRVIIDFARRRT